MKIRAIVKTWGSSLGIVLPKEVVKKKHLKAKEEILIEIIKKPDLMKLFGLVYFKKSTQKLKDEARRGW